MKSRASFIDPAVGDWLATRHATQPVPRLSSYRQALEHGEGEVQVSLSRETANLVVRVVEARAAGREVVVANTAQEVTPAEAATITAMSRPQVRKLMDLGHLDFRMVGTHHRVPLDSVNRYMATEPTRRRAALQHLADLQNDLGLLE